MRVAFPVLLVCVVGCSKYRAGEGEVGNDLDGYPGFGGAVDGIDRDHDGHPSFADGGDDCDDADPGIHPGAREVWYDGIDQNCKGDCDGDQDGDGYVLEGWAVRDADACDADPTDQAFAPTDCDDTDPLAAALLLSTTPVDGGSTHPWRDVRATLYDQDAAGVLVVADGAGERVSGTNAWSGPTLVFEPDVMFAPLAAYTATLTWGCGTETWSFTTNDGTGQDFLHEWPSGPPDSLRIEVVNADATLYGFGMAETGDGAVGWYGEDCAGERATGSCHPMAGTELALESVATVGEVVPGWTTLFDASDDLAITYYVEARTGPEQGSCWAWGHDPAYFGWCEAI